jgi:ATP-binding cassette, subfamily F, member 3
LDETPKLKKPDPEEAISLFFEPREPLPFAKRLVDDHSRVLDRNGRILARDLELTVLGRDRVAIIGANGCGKTTYLKHLIAVAQAMGTRVGVMPQEYDAALDLTQSPVEALTISKTAAETTRIMTLLGSLKFTESEMRQPLSQCSQGQKAKVLLTSLVLSEADLLVLDEPTRNLSPLTLPVIIDMLKAFPGAILAVSHDRRFLHEGFTRIMEMTVQGLYVRDLTDF